MRRLFPTLLLLLPALTGCFNGDTGLPPEGEITVWNRSQFPLLEVRVHEVGDGVDATNLTPDGLPQDGSLTEVVDSGSYVTVIREKVAGGPTIAVTTSQGLKVGGGRYTLMVFDNAFRLVYDGTWDPPDAGNEPATDAGLPGDGGTL